MEIPTICAVDKVSVSLLPEPSDGMLVTTPAVLVAEDTEGDESRDAVAYPDVIEE